MSPNVQYWLIAIIGMVANLGVTMGLIFMKTKEFYEVPIPPPEVIIGSPEYFNFFTEGIDQLSKDLKNQKEALKQREALVVEMEARMESEKEELVRMRKEVETMRKEFDEKILTIEAGEQKNLKELATTFTNLAPQTAISIFKEMDDAFVVKILSMLPKDNIAPIFQTMAGMTDESGPMTERVAEIIETMRLMHKEKVEK